jgi:hypothetical protein
MSENIGNNVEEDESRDDLIGMSLGFAQNLNYKVAMFLFFASLMIFSDLFIEQILMKFKGSVEGDCPTSKGTIIQITFLVLFYLVIDLLVKAKYV